MPDQGSAATEHAILQEITAPLERLPEDPLAEVEAEFPAAMRGYDRHAVDDYVEHTRRLVAELQATRSPEAAVRRALERVGEQISGILQRAHETAEQITAQSRAEAEDRMQAAREEAAGLVAAARERVAELDADTDRIWAERQRIVADAEDLSAQLGAVARDAAHRFADDSETAAADAAPAPAPADERLIVRLDAPEPEPELDEGPELAFEAPLADPAEMLDDTAEPDRDAAPDDLESDDPGVEDTVVDPTEEHLPLRITDEDATHIIPPSSEAANRRRDGE